MVRDFKKSQSRSEAENQRFNQMELPQNGLSRQDIDEYRNFGTRILLN